jgi:Transposase DDE domain
MITGADMPYKERLKTGGARKNKKTGYRQTNCHEYNQSLRKRGMISMYFPNGDIKSQFFCSETYIKGVSGRIAQYKAAYVELSYTLYRLFRWGLRQISGYLEDYWKSRCLDIPAPSYGHLSDMFATLKIPIKQRCEKLAKRLKNGESVCFIVDSTGLRFSMAGGWYEKKIRQGS